MLMDDKKKVEPKIHLLLVFFRINYMKHMLILLLSLGFAG